MLVHYAGMVFSVLALQALSMLMFAFDDFNHVPVVN